MVPWTSVIMVMLGLCSSASERMRIRSCCSLSRRCRRIDSLLFSMDWNNFSSWTGLRTNCVMPISIASIKNLLSLYAVKTMICASGESLRISRAISSPVMNGIIISVKTISTASFRYSSNPSRPFLAVSRRKPLRLIMRPSCSRVVVSSST